jgi:Protein of unknown function (DUF3383)
MSLQEIIDVQVDIQTSSIAQAGFDIPLIFAHHNYFADLVREYEFATFATEMITDGFPLRSAAYQAALSLSKQPHGRTFKVGKRQAADVQKVRLIPITIANSAIYQATVQKPNGVEVVATFTSDASATLAEVCTGLAAAINAATGEATASGASGTWVENTGVADEQWGFSDLTANLFLIDESASSGSLGLDLTALREADDDWYGLALPSSAPASIEECVDWIESDGTKIFIAQTHDMKVFDATTYASNIFKSVKDQGYVRSHVTYNSHALVFYGGAWLTQLLTFQPGEADFKFKTVKGAVAEKLSAANAGKLKAQNASWYERVYKDKAITRAAVGAGDATIFLDLTMLSDWTKARMIEAVLFMFTSAAKVPHTDEGGGNAIWGAYKSVLDQGIKNEAIDGDPTTWEIFVPQRKDLSPSDRANRRWPGTSLKFTPTGALQSLGPVKITLNVA